MEKAGGLPEAEVFNQPLPSEEEMAEASQRSALAIANPKETVQRESYEGPIRVVLEEGGAKKLSKTTEGKKKRKRKEKRVNRDEEARPKKEKNKKKLSEKRERKREEKHLKKEEKRKRTEIPDVDGESTTTSVEEEVSPQENESVQPQEASMHIRMVATEDREDPDITPLMRSQKENVPQGEAKEQRKEWERKQRQKSCLALAQDKGKAKVGNSEPALTKRRPSTKKENDDMMMKMGFFPASTPLPDLITSVVLEHGWETFC
ncbi:nucleolar protein 58-like [Benincasa hispida]|uniref:nucleolar protein 58-like n=1 Tax=Benincasa hispida TaxID=102211 RepID=UPI0019024D25|nr:nucleolar protein 58-like [Benincasa hispida]